VTIYGFLLLLAILILKAIVITFSSYLHENCAFVEQKRFLSLLPFAAELALSSWKTELYFLEEVHIFE